MRCAERLFKILSTSKYEHILKWSENGNSFIIFDRDAFKSEVFPKILADYQKQRLVDFTGFFRNRGFTRNHHVLGEEFRHPFFLRGQKNILKLCNKNHNKKKEIPDLYSEVSSEHAIQLNDIKELKQNNNDLEIYLKILSNSNEIAWMLIKELVKHHDITDPEITNDVNKILF